MLLLLLYACGQPIAKSRTSPLDYAELSRNDGWYLRVHGDGSGSLTHRQYPHHHLEYPLQTFDLARVRAVAVPCHTTVDTGSCYHLTYYRSAADRILTCSCAPSAPLDEAMTTAIANMQTAVDNPSSERSCRMLRRVWLASR
ncbi:hypothetical protein CLV84_0066 [Neolewinella xylanilytica]|uniref:Uncharacterized protein n=1 Tax=Neolewinella xylanilytica TaxID=1514080 RepID=A0A2S6I6I9_9BACT|nr:hypothetical protein [Neolewinella xylanilytica]PPK87132.1 hypothetical protein CLV84_0066 [Neolewinella xylanilytica]